MLLKPREVAVRLKVPLRTVYWLIGSGKITYCRIGSGRGTVRVSERDLAEFLKQFGAQGEEQ